jgi:hypothetical protein
MKTVTLQDFLTEDEINQCLLLKDRKRVQAEIIEPNMERINTALGQENDAAYLSFMVEYVMTTAGAWKSPAKWR